MKRCYFFLLLLIPGSFTALCQSVTFILRSPNLPDSSKVYITGSAPQLSNWNPGSVKMTFSGNHTWQKQLQLQPQNGLEYKYTLGSWAQEGTDTAGKPLQNFIINIANDTVIQDEVNNWQKDEEPPVTDGITGTVKYHRNLKGKGIPPRDLVVWLPPDYDTAKGKRYPVLYMHDGQNIFDPATSAFGNEWRIDETADSLIRSHAIEPIIVVGIYNTPNRSDEYTPGKQANAYMDFVVNTVKPLIDQTYRTKPGPKDTATGGSSAGGIVAFMLAWEHPDVFSKTICMSPAFKIEDIDYVDNVLAYQGKKKPLFFYIDNGGIELEKRLQPGVDQMLAALQAKGYKEGKDFYWEKAPKAPHSEAAWAKRMPAALKLLFPAK